MRQSKRPARTERGQGERAKASVLIHGRNAVLEAARAGRVVRVMQASGLGHDPRLEELAQAGFGARSSPPRSSTPSRPA